MDTQQFLDAVGRILTAGDETLIEQLGELMLKAHEAEIERAKLTGQQDIPEQPLATILTDIEA
jgi:hypothetical protein